MPISLEVWGDYACFTRPEMKTERVSYDIMTPSAARGLLESIYWHPGMRWVIDRIHVCAPIRFTNLRRNEVKSTISARSARTVMERGRGELYLTTSQDIQQRASLLLQDVRYVIEAHFSILPEKAAVGDNPGKFQDIATRRIAKGQFYHQPCFGCREFPAQFRLCRDLPPCPEELKGERDLGYMLWDLDYSDSENIVPLLFRAGAPGWCAGGPRPGQRGGDRMILQALVEHYEDLAAQGKLARPGWSDT